MRPRTRRELVALAASGAAALSGCPGFDTSSDPGVETPVGRTTPEPDGDDSDGDDGGVPSPPGNPPLSVDGQWPQANFDAGNTACDPNGEGLREIEPHWRLDAGGSPTMAGGALYNLTRNDRGQDQLTQRDPATAAVRTRTTLPTPRLAGPPAVGQYVYVSTPVRPVAVRRSRGMVWEGPVVDGAAGPPTLRGDRVYVAGRGDRARGTLPRVAAITADGDLVWDVALADPAVRSPAVDSGLVVVATDSGVLGFVNGVEQWRYDVRAHGTPVTADDLVFVPGPDRLHVLDATEGTSLWTARPTGESLVVTEDLVIAGGRDRTVARDRYLGEFAWERSGVGRPLAAAGDTLYAALGSSLTALDLEEGVRLWSLGATRVALSGPFFGDVESVTPVDGGLYVRTTEALHGLGPA